MIRVTNIRVRSYDIDSLDVFWDIEPTYEDVLDYTFVVERSGFEFGPYFDLTSAFRDKYHLRDNTVRGQHGFYQKHYYRITVTNTQTGEVATYPEGGFGIAQAAPPDLFALEMARTERLILKEHKGRRVILLPRKTFGQRCSCYDRVTQRRTQSNCRTCYDTGWVGGFGTPLETYAQVRTPTETTVNSQHAQLEVENTRGKFSNYPELEEGWIVVEQENIRWRVGPNIEKYKKSRAIIRQEADLHRIYEGDIEYTVPINLSNDEDILATPIRNYTNPQNLSTAGLSYADLTPAGRASGGGGNGER